MAQASKTTKTSTAKAKTKRGPGRPPKKKEPERPEFLGSEMVIIGTFALAVLLFLSNFHLCGVVGDFLRSLQLGLFGMVGYVLPLALFVGACFYLSNRGNPVALMKLGAAVAAALVLCALGEAIFGDPFRQGVSLGEFYKSSAATGLGGGILGGAVSHGLYSLVGTVGTYLILLVILAVSLVLITERSLLSPLGRQSRKAYEEAKRKHQETAVIRARQAEERREAEARRREEESTRAPSARAAPARRECRAESPSPPSPVPPLRPVAGRFSIQCGQFWPNHAPRPVFFRRVVWIDTNWRGGV